MVLVHTKIHTNIKNIDKKIVGEDACREAIHRCYDETVTYTSFLKEYISTHGSITKNSDYLALVTEYFKNQEKPSCLGYAMTTFKAHNAKRS